MSNQHAVVITGVATRTDRIRIDDPATWGARWVDRASYLENADAIRYGSAESIVAHKPQ